MNPWEKNNWYDFDSGDKPSSSPMPRRGDADNRSDTQKRNDAYSNDNRIEDFLSDLLSRQDNLTQAEKSAPTVQALIGLASKWGVNAWEGIEHKLSSPPELKKGVNFADKQTENEVNQACVESPEFAAIIEKLKLSEEIYYFQGVKKNVKGAQGVFHTDGEKLIVSYKRGEKHFGLGTLSSLFHETEHARQFENGELGFVYNENLKWWQPSDKYDIIDEAKAFEFSFLAKGSDKIYIQNHYGTREKVIEYLRARENENGEEMKIGKKHISLQFLFSIKTKTNLL